MPEDAGEGCLITMLCNAEGLRRPWSGDPPNRYPNPYGPEIGQHRRFYGAFSVDARAGIPYRGGNRRKSDQGGHQKGGSKESTITKVKGQGMNWYLKVLKKYAIFSGRARRKEYWMFMLFNFIIGFALGIVEVSSILVSLYSLAVLLPGMAVAVRRLHDTGRSGWWLLIGIVPIIGALVLLVFMVQDSQSDDNQYGPNPKAVASWEEQTQADGAPDDGSGVS